MSLSGNGTYGGGKPKHQDRIKAQEWTKNLWQSAIATGAKVYLEQPMSVLCQVLGKRTQAIHPWEHGHGETKETWLWLHGLKPLMPSEISLGRENRIWKMGPSPTRTADRSRTYPGIAKAMADQWGR
jgi:hypothetical protein